LNIAIFGGLSILFCFQPYPDRTFKLTSDIYFQIERCFPPIVTNEQTFSIRAIDIIQTPTNIIPKPSIFASIALDSLETGKWLDLPANAPGCPHRWRSLSLENGAQLANYAIDVNLGGSVVSEYQIKPLDLDYFDGE
jgi:hypothetical protein